jgi:branched-chain amino acid transport system ATP-binding protein
VVEDLHLTVREGEIVALLGPNGAGKSTTLLGLAGVLSPSSGVLEWLGRPARSSLPKRARGGLAFIPEQRSVIFSLSTHDNLRLGRGDPDLALELFPELEPLLARRAGLLSGGEQQMVALARALSRRPRLLLVDELSLGLAPVVVHRLATALVDAAATGVGVLLVEQQVRQALDISQRAVVLRRGRIVLEGLSADLVTRIDEVEASYFNDDPSDGSGRSLDARG